MSDLLSLAAIGIALWALYVARSQLRHDQDVAGGRGVLFHVSRATQRITDGRMQANFEVRLELFGPGLRHNLEMCLACAGGRYVTEFPGGLLARDNVPNNLREDWKVRGCTDEAVRWDFSVVPADAVRDDVWCMLTWLEPRGEALWTGAYARRLNDPEVLYEWRWYKARSFLRWLHAWGAGSRGPDGFRFLVASKERPLGKWHRHPQRGVLHRQGPSWNLGQIKS